VALRNEKGEKLRIQLTQLLWVSGETALNRPMLGLELAVFHLIVTAVLAIGIIGLSLAAQHLKMTRLALLPFGFEVRDR
jgi:uncharacterized membrane protein YccF (DUF307 family)